MDFMDSVLIIGGGGREHAILKALLRSDRALCIYAYPGNAGMEDNGCMSVDAGVNSWSELVRWSVENQIDLVVVGPEIPLGEGVVDIFTKRGIPAFGPTAKAAEIECSKEFSKNLMKKYGIPTADFAVVKDKEEALEYLAQKGAPIVVKASGLAAGKGVIVCETDEEARGAITTMFDDKAFGEASDSVVMEEKLVGEEASIFVLCDGKNYRVLPPAQDHKRVFDNDKGPNTGGMGAYAPAPVATPEIMGQIERDIIVPTLDAMKAEGRTYRGLLYAGVILTEQGPKVIEFNCRFGDPETECVLPLVNADWYDVFMSCTNGTLDKVDMTIEDGYCVTVVMASEGYPGPIRKGVVIKGIADAEAGRNSVDVCHAGTTRSADGEFVTAGGRVLAVCAKADSLEEAVASVYEAVSSISFEGAHFRRDIAVKGIKRLNSK